jgi:hypothetical protein
MKQPTDDEIERLLMHWGTYNPIQAHQYYEQHKHLKGRKKGQGHVTSARRNAAHHPNRNSARHKQKIHLQNRIENLQSKLGQLEAMIHKKEAILRKDQAHAKGKAHKKKDTPKTAAQKAKAARENKKYRQKHHSQLKAKAKQAGKGGGGHKSGTGQKTSQKSIAELKALATKVRGQIAVAKQKLAAL